ncbi:hypothetical protein ONZ43_g7288 [Nemania bipapillata]|uniref:Uncharacterized protein n=1 Tax=Nemania bipapillata TaxID=110536 RepID=A0ACC2HSD0_9PEZI|nr:hypothetical protein ONZ43_g7288 [Nemania bipapillata]
MHCSLPRLAAASICLPAAQARILGPLNPAPADLTSGGSSVRSQWENLTSTLEGHLNGTMRNEALSGLDNITFSLGLFSVDDPTASAYLQYHHTGPDVRNSSLGVSKVDGNSIYRVASMTKVITVYAGLLLLDTGDWHKPLTEIFPETASLPGNDPVHHIQSRASLRTRGRSMPASSPPCSISPTPPTRRRSACRL